MIWEINNISVKARCAERGYKNSIWETLSFFSMIHLVFRFLKQALVRFSKTKILIPPFLSSRILLVLCRKYWTLFNPCQTFSVFNPWNTLQRILGIPVMLFSNSDCAGLCFRFIVTSSWKQGISCRIDSKE